MTIEFNYRPCHNCQRKLDKYLEKQEIDIELHKEKSEKLKRTKQFTVSEHGLLRANQKGINLKLEKETFFATCGELIEVQKGKFPGEYKLIFLAVRKTHNIKETLHYVYLFTLNDPLPMLVNVYSPFEGMFFKWRNDGKRREFLNSFRDCCPHPLDDVENYYKEHQAKNHRIYEYYNNKEEAERKLMEVKKANRKLFEEKNNTIHKL